jgi:hypothetical protein
MNEVTKKLEVSLGPETGDLCMRFGLHSGPVTAGVLRGEKSRFQLFGDTVSWIVSFVQYINCFVIVDLTSNTINHLLPFLLS